jgi:hypothetical protein
MATTISPDLDNQLLLAFLSPSLDLAAIAAETGLTLPQLAAWFRQPETQAALEELRGMARYRAQLLADLGLPAAVDTLQRVNANLAQLEAEPDAPITLHLRLADTARRTATAIQRLASPRGSGVLRGIGLPADEPSDHANTHPAAPHASQRARDHPAAA